MSLFPKTERLLRLALLLGVIALNAPLHAAPANGPVFLAPHRAAYDLKLSKSKGAGGIESIRGRILYDFSGNDCEGYQVQFRQVSELASAEGKSIVTDTRSTIWEDGAATQLRFSSENLLDNRTTESVDGQAERRASAVNVRLTKPKAKTFSFPASTVFPTDHMRRIILAAREGKNILEFPVFDGAETGEKLYNTLTIIGRPIAPDEKPKDAAGKAPELAKLTRWPVTISYFDTTDKKREQIGEQTPTYSISFEMYENGVSRSLVLNYVDFTITGEMSSLTMEKVKPCQ